MQDVLYGEKGLPKRLVPHLLAANDTIQEELKQLANIFLSQLPKDMPCDCRLGEVHKIHTKLAATPICR